MPEKPKESDWKTFRKMAPEFREKYLRKVNSELKAFFQKPELSPTEQFWEVQERVEKEVRILRDCLDGHSRSKMEMFMVVMYRHGMLLDEDLNSFSEELSERIKEISEI